MHFLAFSDMYEKSGLPTLCTSHTLLSSRLRFRKRFSFDGHGSSLARHEIKAAYDAEIEAAAGARFVTVVSEDHEKELREIGVRCIRRVLPPFDTTSFSPEEPQSARIRAGISDALTISYVGRPDRRKGIEILISACEKLASNYSNFQLMIVGYGFQKSEGKLSFGSGRLWFDVSILEARGVKIILEQATSGRGPLLYSASDIVVIPSIYEPMGYVALEAMASARPVVASRTGGLCESIEDEVTGMLFEPDNASDLAKRFERLVRDARAKGTSGSRCPESDGAMATCQEYSRRVE